MCSQVQLYRAVLHDYGSFRRMHTDAVKYKSGTRQKEACKMYLIGRPSKERLHVSLPASPSFTLLGHSSAVGRGSPKRKKNYTR